MGAVPFGAVGTVREKPPSTGVALENMLVTVDSNYQGIIWTYGTKIGPVTVMKAP